MHLLPPAQAAFGTLYLLWHSGQLDRLFARRLAREATHGPDYVRPATMDEDRAGANQVWQHGSHVNDRTRTSSKLIALCRVKLTQACTAEAHPGR